MKTTSQIFLVLILLITFTSCESENSDLVSQNSIKTYYDLSFDEDERQLLFLANFKSRNKQIWITANSSISFEGNRMAGKKDIFSQIFYRYRHNDLEPNQIRSRYSSEYINEDGKSFVNNFKMPSPINFTPYGEASRETGLKIRWNLERDLGDAEELSVRLYVYDNGSHEIERLRIKKSSADLTLGREHFENIEDSEIGIKICHKTYTRRITGPISGGSFAGTYCTRMEYIELND